MTPEEIQKIKNAAPTTKERTHKFAPKLTDKEKHQAYLLLQLGYSQSVVSKVFGIARSTAGHMNRDGHHYREVRNDFQSLGLDGFIEKYGSLALMDRANEIRDLLNKESAPTGLSAPNRQADKKAGWHEIAGRRYFVHFMDYPDDGRVGWTYDEGTVDMNNLCTVNSDVMEPTSAAALKKMIELEKEGML